MATWGDQTCQRFEATAVGFETGFSRLRVRPSNRYAIAPHSSLMSHCRNIHDAAQSILLTTWQEDVVEYKEEAGEEPEKVGWTCGKTGRGTVDEESGCSWSGG